MNEVHAIKEHPIAGMIQRHMNRWHFIVAKCYDKRCLDYQWYGARGIGMCQEWLDDPALFVAHLLIMPGNRNVGWHFDREDYDGDYTPENTRFVSPQVGCANKRQETNRG